METSGTALERFFWQGRLQTAFWKVATLFSLAVNLTLVVALLLGARLLFGVKNGIASPLLNTAYGAFVQMDDAAIVADIVVEDEIPVAFDLPVQTNTVVRLTEDTFVANVPIAIQEGGISINAPADIVLPKGTPLSIALDIHVPVTQTIPVTLTVPVNIPLDQTELHRPFTGLRDLVGPYKDWLDHTASNWRDVLCRSPLVCRFVR